MLQSDGYLIEYPFLEQILQNKTPKQIFRSKELSQIGDFITNYIYTIMRIGIKGKAGSIHVWDQSLAQATIDSGLRKHFPSRSRTKFLADGVEALIGYVYLNKLMTLEDMIDVISQWVSNEDVRDRTMEKLACTTAFEKLIREIFFRTKHVFNW